MHESKISLYLDRNFSGLIMEYNKEYDNQGQGEYDYGYGAPEPNKSIKGLKIMIVILAVILAALSVMYFTQVRQIRADFAEERDTLTNRLTMLLADYDNLETENDTISKNLAIERNRADSLLQSLQKERNLSRAKIRDYEKRLGYMRNVMEGYIHQIDSLNTVNQRLVQENTNYRKEASSLRLRADMAEEKAEELSTKVRKGAVIRARDISLLALSERDREVSRANRAARLRVDLVLVGNELATPGERNVFVRIISPEGYLMPNPDNAAFNYEGEMITFSASRSVDYQNEDLPVSLFYNGGGITSGKYQVLIYTDGYLIGSSEIVLR